MPTPLNDESTSPPRNRPLPTVVPNHRMTGSGVDERGRVLLQCECGWYRYSKDIDTLTDTAANHLAAQLTNQQIRERLRAIGREMEIRPETEFPPGLEPGLSPGLEPDSGTADL